MIPADVPQLLYDASAAPIEEEYSKRRIGRGKHKQPNNQTGTNRKPNKNKTPKGNTQQNKSDKLQRVLLSALAGNSTADNL